MAGTAASLRGNVKVVADAVGNLYVSHGWGHRVYRLDAASGILSPLAGDGFSGEEDDLRVGDAERGAGFGDGEAVQISAQRPRVGGDDAAA